MLVNHAHQFAYTGPPKTATTSLHQWLSQPSLSVRRFDPEMGDQHATSVPPLEGYFHFASVRNPFDRAVSLWRHSQVSGPWEDPPVPRMDFPQFVQWIARAGRGRWFYSRGQAEHLAGVRWDALVRVEHLSVDLSQRVTPIRRLLVVGEYLEALPRLNTTEHRDWPEYYSEDTAQAILEFWGDDFALGPYSERFELAGQIT